MALIIINSIDSKNNIFYGNVKIKNSRNHEENIKFISKENYISSFLNKIKNSKLEKPFLIWIEKIIKQDVGQEKILLLSGKYKTPPSPTNITDWEFWNDHFNFFSEKHNDYFGNISFKQEMELFDSIWD